MKKKTIMMIMVAGLLAAKAQERTDDVGRLLKTAEAAAKAAKENGEMAQKFAKMLEVEMAARKEAIKEVNQATRGWQRAQVRGFVDQVRGLKAKVGVYLEAIELLKETGGLEEAEEFVEGSAMCLFEEANLRAQWRALVRMPMTQETRDEAGKVWVEMTAQIDELAKVLETRKLGVPDQRLVDEWKAARAAPPAPEPEIVAE
jgi:hypothetical protein